MKPLFFPLLFFYIGLFLYADKPGNMSQEKVLIEKGEEGEKKISLVIKASSLYTIFLTIAEKSGFELFLDEGLRLELEKKYLPVFLKNRDWDEALDLLTKAVGCSYRTEENKLFIAKDKQEIPEAKDIITGYKKLLLSRGNGKDNKSAEEETALFYFTLGAFFYLQNKPEMSFAELDALVQQFPQSETALYALLLMAKCAIQNRDYKKAQTVLSRYFQDFSKSAFTEYAFFLLAHCYEKLHELEQAKRVYEYMIHNEKIKDKGKANALLGKLYLQQKNYNAACSHLDQALANISDSSSIRPQILVDYIQCLIEQGKKTKAKEKILIFYKHFSSNPLCERVRFWHALLCIEAKDFMMGYCLLRPLLDSKRAKTRLSSAFLISSLLREMEMYPFAIQTIEKALSEAVPGSIEERQLLYELGLIYQKQGDWESAKQTFSRLSERFLSLDFTLLQSHKKNKQVAQEWERLESLKKEYQALQQNKWQDVILETPKEEAKEPKQNKHLAWENFIKSQSSWNEGFSKWQKAMNQKISALSQDEPFMKKVPAKPIAKKEASSEEDKPKEEAALKEIHDTVSREEKNNAPVKAKVTEPSWYLALVSHIEAMEKIFPKIQITDANMAISIARIQNYFPIVKNYPSEISTLVQKLRKNMASGKSIRLFLQQELPQDKKQEKHFLLLNNFVSSKRFPMEEKSIYEIGNILKKSKLDDKSLQSIRECFEKIHIEFEENRRHIGQGIAQWEAKE
ncbi:MAG: tetratricopeptide repeat protein [Candidatus Brocadiae bacterium]|nr:tetratricopeptide repeat protein [Candidatus Brocadiia bacterium]